MIDKLCNPNFKKYFRMLTDFPQAGKIIRKVLCVELQFVNLKLLSSAK